MFNEEMKMEWIGELLLEFVMYMTKNKKISKWVRYPILFVIIGLYGFIILGILSLSIEMILERQCITAILFIGVDILLIGGRWTFYFEKNGGKS